MLKQAAIKKLQESKNLLAFSGGVDSSALFFILLEQNIKFDIAIVDYGIREQSVQEVLYAKELAKEHALQCHLFCAPLIESNFEANARALRYDFFEQTIQKYNYENLITAHHLGDRFEWMLMQFCKGAGCAELSGMKPIQKRENYSIVRPLLHLDKQELLHYLHRNNIKYFEDESNSDETIQRNLFRHNYTNPLLKTHLKGIKKSFEYIDADVETLIDEQEIHKVDNLTYFKNSHKKRSNIFTIDKYFKSELHMMSAHERKLLESNTTVVIGRKFVVNQREDYILIAPYIKNKTKLSSEFKEECRKLKIEPKLREFLFLNPHIFSLFKELLRG